ARVVRGVADRLADRVDDPLAVLGRLTRPAHRGLDGLLHPLLRPLHAPADRLLVPVGGLAHLVDGALDEPAHGLVGVARPLLAGRLPVVPRPGRGALGPVGVTIAVPVTRPLGHLVADLARELHPPLGRVAGRGPHPLAVGAVARAGTHPLLGAVAPIVVLRALVGLAVGASRPLAASRAAALPPLRLVGRLALARSHRAAAVAVLVVSGIRVGRLPPVPLVVIGAAFGPLLVLGAVPFVGVGARPL